NPLERKAMPADIQKPIVLTREELYAQVWAKPISQLSAEYGMSGRGLAKLCARHIIPCPPRGYWARKAAGKAVVQFRLPEPKADTPLKITIFPTQEAPPPTAAQIEVAQGIEAARELYAHLVVPTRLTRPHPIIAKWLAEHKREVEEAKRERDPST